MDAMKNESPTSELPVSPNAEQIVITIAGGNDPVPRELAFERRPGMAVDTFVRDVVDMTNAATDREIRRRMSGTEGDQGRSMPASKGLIEVRRLLDGMGADVDSPAHRRQWARIAEIATTAATAAFDPSAIAEPTGDAS